jgi:hypothetical protein
MYISKNCFYKTTKVMKVKRGHSGGGREGEKGMDGSLGDKKE